MKIINLFGLYALLGAGCGFCTDPTSEDEASTLPPSHISFSRISSDEGQDGNPLVANDIVSVKSSEPTYEERIAENRV